MEIPDIKRGTWLVIRVDGSSELKGSRPTIDAIHEEIGCELCDTVTLRHRNGTQDAIVMLVDDTGALDGAPVNLKATELYWFRCKPGTKHQIHGDVAIANDEDFAS